MCEGIFYEGYKRGNKCVAERLKRRRERKTVLNRGEMLGVIKKRAGSRGDDDNEERGGKY